MKFDETRNISAVIPVRESEFVDDKEITELFNYVFERSELYNSLNAVYTRSCDKPTTFKITYDNGGCRVCTFTLSLKVNDDTYDQRMQELELLVDDYDRIQEEYIRFKAFGNIESESLIRRRNDTTLL